MTTPPPSPAFADTDLIPALAAAFPGFDFSLAHVDDDYWRGTRVSELRPRMTAELAKDGVDVKAVWQRQTCRSPNGAAPVPSRRPGRRGRLHPDCARS